LQRRCLSSGRASFFSGSATLVGNENFEKMRAVVTKAYGQPTFVNERLAICKWEWPGPGGRIMITLQLTTVENNYRVSAVFVNERILELRR
jgi:hypothetical protein